jgi:hypothetical protein
MNEGHRIIGRGTQRNPRNRFERLEIESRCRRLGLNQTRVHLSVEKFLRQPSHPIQMFA